MNVADHLRAWRSVLLAGVLIAGVTMGYLNSSGDVPVGAGLLAAEPGLTLPPEPKPLPALSFEDGDGNSVNLSDFRGRVILLNVCTTWCAPCREEMPTLDRLQAILGGPDFEVVALSVDQRA